MDKHVKLVDKEHVDTLLAMHRRWLSSMDNQTVDRANVKLTLQNYVMTLLPEICTALESIDLLEKKLVSYEELIERLSGNVKKGTTAGTGVEAKVQTAVVDFEDEKKESKKESTKEVEAKKA